MSFLLTVSRTALMGLILAPTLLLSDQAFAADLAPAYVGASWAASSDYSLSCWRGIPSLDCDRGSSRGGKLYAGYALGESVVFGSMKNASALELSVFGSAGVVGYMPRWDGALMQGRYQMAGLALTHASALMLTDALGLNSRLGLAYTRGSVDYPTVYYRLDDYGAGGSDHRYRLGVTAGVGLSYALNGNWALHADYDFVPVRYSAETGNSHVNMWSLGASYHF